MIFKYFIYQFFCLPKILNAGDRLYRLTGGGCHAIAEREQEESNQEGKTNIFHADRPARLPEMALTCSQERHKAINAALSSS